MMSLEELKKADRVIGIKQVTKAVKKGMAQRVFLADDADAHCVAPLIEVCHAMAVEPVRVATMKELGQACGIEVGAAAAAVLQ